MYSKTAIYAEGVGLGASKGKEVGKYGEGYSGYVSMAQDAVIFNTAASQGGSAYDFHHYRLEKGMDLEAPIATGRFPEEVFCIRLLRVCVYNIMFCMSNERDIQKVLSNVRYVNSLRQYEQETGDDSKLADTRC